MIEEFFSSFTLRDGLYSIFIVYFVHLIYDAIIHIFRSRLHLDVQIGFNKQARVQSIAFVTALIITMANLRLLQAIQMEKKLASTSTGNKRKSSTIVGVMFFSKLKRAVYMQLILFLSLVAHFIFVYALDIPLNYAVVSIAALGFLLIHLDQILIRYRVKKGWYGTNEYEAKEIISFILNHADKNDFTNSGGLKKVIPLPSIIEETDVGKECTQQGLV